MKPRSHKGSVDPLDSFHPAVAGWFRNALGNPTEVQALAWPKIAAGETTLVLAPTGSGKTLAAFLAAIDRLARTPAPEDPRSRLRVLYISPLKALAVDIERNLRAPLAGIAEEGARIGSKLRRLDAAVRTGDTPANERAKMLRSAPDVLITTPESLYLLLTSSQREMVASVDTVIVDEIHQMAASKRGTHLFLSLERLEALRSGRGAERPLQRIGLSATQRPLEEIARLLGGFATKGKRLVPRPVAIVDASRKRALSISVEVPPPLPDDGLELDDEDEETRSVWPQIHARLVERIRGARSTMIFVNSRRLAERLAAALNEVAGEELALAHHGSVAKEKRSAIEEQLKAGELRAIVATSSLELGIDMGAVDQVIQVEAPPSVASGIQRIGRASHHVGGVPSGILVPKHKHDLLACAAAAGGIEDGDVEETFYVRNALDVLAQQIVAIASVGLSGKRPTGKHAASPRGSHPATDVDEVFDLVRRAAPYAELSREIFDGVLDMLAGRYPSDEFSDLRPRITWDRTRGTIAPRSGSQRLAILNGGTIPDRGLYGVFLATGDESADSKKSKPSRRVGELDEEMVFELREGEVFLLGASSWRAEQITRDRVLVTPAPGSPGKMPFWHGDRAGRTAAFGTRVGSLAREVAAAIGTKKKKPATEFLTTKHHLDDRSVDDLVQYVGDEVGAIGLVPSDRTIVVERVPDELGDLRLCILSPFGSRVHAPWAMAALRRLREARAGDIEAVWTDDGIVFRIPGGEAPLPTHLLFPSPEEIEDMVTRELGDSSLFAARFREAAARALLLPRRAASLRTPLWAQRKRAADLLAVATQFPSFPIVLETYRECLKDVFDLPGLIKVLRDVESRKLQVTTVDTTTPSPFAASLLFSFVGNFLYDGDAPAAERRAQALTIDQAQLRQLLGEAEQRRLLDPDVILEHERSLQRRDRPIRHADALHDLLLWLGDSSEASIVERSTEEREAQAWISELVRAKRIVRVRIANENRYIAVEDAGRYRDALGTVIERGLPDAFLSPTKDALVSLVARHARTHGPFVARAVAQRFGLGEESIRAALEKLVSTGKVVSGAFLANERATERDAEYCDAGVLRALKQKTLARLRKAIEPVDAPAFARFLAEWHGISNSGAPPAHGATTESLLRAIGQLEGCPIPASVLESEVLPARVPGFLPHHLDQLLASGEVVWAGLEPIGSDDGRVALYLADQEALLSRPPTSPAPDSDLHRGLRDLFERRGALFFPEIARTLGGFPRDVHEALWDLVWTGELTNDTFEPLRSLRKKDDRRGRPGRHERRPPGREGRSEGRWSLRRSRWEREPTSTERATAIARSLLERYGIVLRESAGVEGIAGGFGSVYDVLRAMEDQGRVRRGYFVGGRGATQFALPGAEERLRARLTENDERSGILVLAATDPANPWGALLPWPEQEGRLAQRTPGARVILHEGKLLAWLSRGGASLVTFISKEEPEASREAGILARALIDMRLGGARRLLLSTIDGVPAPESALGETLRSVGFVSRQGALVTNA